MLRIIAAMMLLNTTRNLEGKFDDNDNKNDIIDDDNDNQGFYSQIQ